MYVEMMMVFGTQNDWASGICPSSIILYTRKQNVSESECFHPQVMGDTCSVGSIRKS
jgi:hypothetical protein